MRRIILWAMALGLLLMLMQYAQYRLLLMRHTEGAYTGLAALVCIAVGIWAGRKWVTALPGSAEEKTEPVLSDAAPVTAHPLTQREWEVLQLMAQGLSNQEIAAALFVSLNTVKTHTSNIFSKLDVQRRTQAVQKAKVMGILPL